MKKFSIMIFLTCFCLGLASITMAETVRIQVYTFANEEKCLNFYAETKKAEEEKGYLKTPGNDYISNYSFYSGVKNETVKNIIPFTFPSIGYNLTREGNGFRLLLPEASLSGFYGNIQVQKEGSSYNIVVEFNETFFYQKAFDQFFASNVVWQNEAKKIISEVEKNIRSQPVLRSLTFKANCLASKNYVFNLSNHEQKTYQVFTVRIN